MHILGDGGKSFVDKVQTRISHRREEVDPSIGRRLRRTFSNCLPKLRGCCSGPSLMSGLEDQRNI